MLSAVYIKGFKTFARPVRMPLEGGITAIVGPNGSGKSNVTDAVLFALGEQSPGLLRAGAMSELIFSGSETLPAASLAEVTLVLDNASGDISLPYEEVALTRRISRDGETEYRINGARARMADVRAVAGEAGIGRHSILRQGAVDAIISGGAAACRMAVEEAAGLGVYRRRRLSASRRLEKAEDELERSRQLEAELADQLRRLEREAVAARGYREIESRYREVSLACLYRTATMGLDDRRARLEALRGRVSELSAREASLRERESGLEGEARALERKLRDQERRLEATEDRAEALRAEALRSERVLLRAGESSDGERQETRRVRRLGEALRNLDGSLESMEEQLREQEPVHAGLQDELERARRRATELREEYARAEGRLAQLSAKAESLEARRERLISPNQKPLITEQTLELLSGSVGALEGMSGGFAAELEPLQERIRGCRLRAQERASEVSRRQGALEAALGRARAAVEKLQHPARNGSVTRLYEVLRPRPGYEAAVEAALGDHGEGVLASGLDEGLRVVSGKERVAVRLDARELEGDAGRTPGIPLLECVEVLDGRYAGAVERLLAGIYVTDDPDTDSPENGHIAVTRDGLRLTRTSVSLPREFGAFAREARLEAAYRRMGELKNGPGVSLAEMEDRVSDAVRKVEELARETSGMSSLAARAERARSTLCREAARRRDAAQRRRREAISGEQEIRRLEREIPAVREAVRQAERDVERARESFEAATAAAGAAGEAFRDSERLVQRLRSSISEGRARRDAVEDELERLERLPGDSAGRLSSLAERTVQAVTGMTAAVRERRAALRNVRAGTAEAHRRAAGEKSVLSRQAVELAGELATARAEAHQAERELQEAERAASEASEEIRAEWGATLEIARQEATRNPDASEKERRRLARKLHSFGDVNLLALSQEGEIRERYAFVSAQRADAESAATEINRIIQEIDREIETRFERTFAEVRRAFGEMVPRMMEGASGVLELSEEGVEIGIKLGRRGWRSIRVLSGGERSLLALSFLFSIFLSRPGASSGAFCVLDEAEAALDDINLARFLSVVDSYRQSGQFLLITHQKRTMAAADVLYGVTQDATGATVVVSKRMQGE